MDTAQGTSNGHLVRQIGLGSGIAVLVGSTIGSGIFKSPSDIAQKMPGPLPMFAVWIIGGLVVLCGALTLAEVGGAFPYSGGLYVYIREAYGRLAAFLFGWAQLVLIRPAGVGAVAVVFGEYALRLFGITQGQPHFEIYSASLAILSLIVATLANVYGVKFGTGVQNLTTIAKTGGLIVLVTLALTLGLRYSGGHFTPAVPSGSFSLPMFGLAMVSVFWVYDGWADATFVSGEFLNPRKNVPRAILFGTLTVIALYLLANLGYLAVYSVGEIAKSPIVAADTMSKLVGTWGVTFIAATVMLSTLGTVNGSILTSPRIFFAMAEDRLFFQPLAWVHPKFKTPHVSVIMSGALGVVYVIVATFLSKSDAFQTLTDAFVIGVVPFYALSVASVVIFRNREKKRRNLLPEDPSEPDSLVDPISEGHLETHPHVYDPPVRVPLFPVVPLVFVAAVLFLLVNSLLDKDSQVATLITLGIVAVGAPLYYMTVGKRRT